MTNENLNLIKETGMENNVDNTEKTVPVCVLDTVTLEDIIREAITMHAESRTERYEVYKDRDEKKYKPNFLRVVRTYAKLAGIRRPNTTIRIVDEWGEERLLNASSFQVPDFLYELVNYSGRVYFCDEDRENENYITEATRKASNLSDEELLKQILSPEDLLSFWRDYNSTTKHQTQLKALNKNDIAFTELCGIMKKDEDAKSGYVFKKFKSTGSVSMTTLQARKVIFDGLAMCGAETETLKLGQIVTRIAKATSGPAADNDGSETDSKDFVTSGN
jgi:hypothetical protein